jgi:DNA topoisomerase IB
MTPDADDMIFSAMQYERHWRGAFVARASQTEQGCCGIKYEIRSVSAFVMISLNRDALR